MDGMAWTRREKKAEKREIKLYKKRAHLTTFSNYTFPENTERAQELKEINVLISATKL